MTRLKHVKWIFDVEPHFITADVIVAGVAETRSTDSGVSISNLSPCRFAQYCTVEPSPCSCRCWSRRF